MLGETLSGLKVLDLTHVLAGPVCAMTLADLGAEVVKIEPPHGELGRDIGPPWIEGESAIHLSVNRNKRGMCIDLKAPAGRDVLAAMIRQADVLIESFRPGVMKRLGFDYERARDLNGRLVYCSISAFGQSGPMADRPGVDGVAQAMSGLMGAIGFDGMPPMKMPTPVADMTTGYVATISILAALREAERRGHGQHLDVSLYNASIMLQQTQFASFFASDEVPGRIGSAASYACPNEAYSTKDGWIMVAAYHHPRWLAFCEVIGRHDLPLNPRFATNAARVAHREELGRHISGALVKRTCREWVKLLADVDVICGAVEDYRGVTESELFEASGLSSHMEHPSAGRVRLPAFAPGPTHRPNGDPRPAPRLGEHTADVLAEFGFEPNQIERLRDQGAIV